MGADPVSIGLGVAGAGMSLMGSSSSARAAKAAGRAQAEHYERMAEVAKEGSLRDIANMKDQRRHALATAEAMMAAKGGGFREGIYSDTWSNYGRAIEERKHDAEREAAGLMSRAAGERRIGNLQASAHRLTGFSNLIGGLGGLTPYMDFGK